MEDRSGTGDPEREAQAARIRAALDRMRDTILEIGAAIEQKKGERCPYRTAQDECTFRGGCINKVREADGTRRCGGDHLLKREPAG